jgi:aminomethyltransferase
MLKRTPLGNVHRLLGARMTEFAGWDMPVQYSGPIQEHMAVREAAGLFDVSHMGEIDIEGPGAMDLLQWVTTNDVSKLKDNQVQYSALTNPGGGIIDDLVLYRINSQYFILVVNASNTEKDFAWLKRQAASFDVEAYDTSAGYALLAIQGPVAERILQGLTDHMLDRVPYYWSQRVKVDGVDCRVSRTGYTGEDGFEILCNPADASHVWNRLLVTGHSRGLIPCGLAARNTLRLEASYRLWGHDMDETTTPIEAGLGWIAKLDKGDFMGRESIERQKREGTSRQLVGFVVEDRAPARDGYPVIVGGRQTGQVSSGSPAPFLKKNVGMAYLPSHYASPGEQIFIVVRGREVPARVVDMPFYKRGRSFD